MKPSRWQIVVAALCVVALGVATVFDAWLRSRLVSDFWPIDKASVAPNILASVVQFVLMVLLLGAFYPPFRHWLEQEFKDAREQRESHHKTHIDLLKQHHHEQLKEIRNNMDTNNLRLPGKRGKKPARHVDTIALHQFKRIEDVAVPTSGDVTNGVTSWGMLGNNQYGNCGVAAFEHLCMAKAATNGVYASDFVVPTMQSTVDLYFAYGADQGEGPNADEGVENATWLSWLFKKNLIEGYAEIDVASPGAADRVHAAMNQFGGVLVGVQLTADAEQLFGAGQPWTTANGETPQANMGHDVALVKYDENGDTFVTWGALQASTIDWDSACIDEAWVFVNRDDAERSGYDFDALLAALKTLPENQEIATPTGPAVIPVPITHEPTGIAGELHALAQRLEDIAKDVEKLGTSGKTKTLLEVIGALLAITARLHL